MSRAQLSRRRLLTLISISLFIAFASMLWHHLTPSTTTIKVTMSPTSPLVPKRAIVVGSGLAGLSAASELVAHGIPVTLLDRAAKPGGNSIKASSGINGAPTKYQPGPSFSDTSFYSDTVRSAGKVFTESASGEKKRRENLIGKLTNESASCIEWLSRKGVDLSVVAELGGHSFPRTHRGAGKTPPGYAIISTLLSSLKTSPLFNLETGCLVTKIITSTSNSLVEGVEYKCDQDAEWVKHELHGPVIFATGGFAGDANGLLKMYRPDLAGFPSTNEARPGSQPLLTEIGAQLVDMQEVQVHPTSFIDPKDPLNPVKFLAAELLRGEGGILLDGEGKRFVNEMETRKVVTDGIMGLDVKAESPRQWDVRLVVDEGVYANASSHIDFYVFKGLMQKTVCSELEVGVVKTVKEYSEAASGERNDAFGRRYFGHWELKPQDLNGDTLVYVGRVTPAVHFTMGGVVINEHGEVLNREGQRIGGVWAAGEVAGGVHGGNRLGGSSLLECCVFGRIAGKEAVRFLQGEQKGG